MGNTHDTEIARIEADYIHTKWRTTEDYRWGYSADRGPETWWVYYPSASGGMQSPIDILTEDAHFDPDLCTNPLEIGYDSSDGGDEENDHSLTGSSGQTMKLTNTGNTATISIANSQYYIARGPCREYTYVLEQIVIHWGEDDNCGSEHLVNTGAYAGEIHFIHWNEDLYDSYEEACKREDGIVIIAVFIKAVEERSNSGLLYLTSLLQDIVYREQSLPLSGSFDPKSLLPDDTSKYWTYKGSFTTPPCFETVTWLVFYEPLTVSSNDLEQFRKLRSYGESEMRPTDEDYDGQIMRNYRTIQPIGTRKIYTVENLHDVYIDEDPFRQDTFARLSSFPECVRMQCGRA